MMTVLVFLTLLAGMLCFWGGGSRPRTSQQQRHFGAISSRVKQQADSSGVSDLPLLLELTAGMLAAGNTLTAAVGYLASITSAPLAPRFRAAARGLSYGQQWSQIWPKEEREYPLTEYADSVAFIADSGAPPVDLLQAEAERLRQQEHRDAEQRCAALGVKLVMPMGLCSLPAFIYWGILPTVISLIPSG